MNELPEDKFCENLKHSDRPEFQALSKVADLEAAREEAEERDKQFRFAVFLDVMQKKGDWDL